MRSKQLNAVLLTIAVAVDAFILYFGASPWVRLTFGLWLLALVIYMASFLELGGLFGVKPPPETARRRFRPLRVSTTTLLAEVRRLNWLVVDLDRGFRSHDTVQADIAVSEQRLEELLNEVKANAGKSDPEYVDDLSEAETPGAPVRERRKGDRRKST